MLRLPIILLLLVMPAFGTLRAQDASDADLRAKRLLVRGLTMLQVGDAPSARASLEMALHLSPNNPAVLAALADAYWQDGNLPEAIHYGGRALTADPGDAENARRLAASYVRDGNPSAASDALNRHRRARPGLASDVLAAHFLVTNGSVAEGLSIVEIAYDAYGPSEAILYPLAATMPSASEVDRWARLTADILNELGDSHLAVPLLDAGSRSGIAVDALGALLVLPVPSRSDASLSPLPERESSVSNRRPAAGSTELLQTAQSNPRDVRAWERAAEALFSEGSVALSHQTAEEATLLFPGHESMTSLRLRTALLLGDREAARAAAMAALRYESNVDLAYAVAAWAADADDELGAEAKEFVRSVPLSDPVARLVAALSLADDATAVQSLDQLLAGADDLARDSSELAGLRGLVERVRGEDSLAREWLSTSVRLGGEFPLVLESLAELLSGDEAHELRQRAAEARTLSK